MSLHKSLTTPLSEEAKTVIKAGFIIGVVAGIAFLIVSWSVQQVSEAREYRFRITTSPVASSYIQNLVLQDVEVFRLQDGTRCAQTSNSISCDWNKKPTP